MKRNILLATALSLASSGSMASGYFGAGVGTVDMGVPGFDDPTGFEIYLGNNVSESVAIEAAYVDFGDAEDDIAPVWTISGNTLAFSAIAKAAINNNVDLYAKLGVHMWDMEVSEEGFGTFYEDDGTDILYGFGIIAKLSDLSIGARYTSYNVEVDGEDEDVTMLSINAQIAF